MEQDYNFHQHTDCMVIHFDNEYFTIKSSLTPINTLETKRETEQYNYKGKACITYDEEKENVLDYGQDPDFEPKNEDTCIDYFLKKIYLYHSNGENFRDEDDEFALKAISEFLRLNLEESIYYREVTRKNPRAFHYIVIVPSEWDPEIKETIIRPLFISAGIILKEDSEDRLLFYTDLEATFYYLERCSKNMDRYDTIKLYEENQQSILCRISSSENGNLLLNLDVIKPNYSTLDVPEPFLLPMVIRTTSVYLLLSDFEKDIHNFLRSILYIESDEVLELMTDHILNYFFQKTTFWYNRTTTNDRKRLFLNADVENWGLTGRQKDMTLSVTISDICNIIDEHLVDGLKHLLEYGFGTRRTLVLAFEHCSVSEKQTHPWIPWIEKVLETKMIFANSELMPVIMAQDPDSHITLSDLMEETIQMSINFLHSYANATITSSAQDDLETIKASSKIALSPVYPDLKLDVVINIDISLSSTIIFVSYLDETGLTRKLYDVTCFDDDLIPYLDQFLDISNITTLKLTKDGFDSIENIFPDYLEYFSKYNRHSKRTQEAEKEKKANEEKKVAKQKKISKGEEEEMKIFPAYEERKLYNFSSSLKETLLSEIQTILSTQEQDNNTQQQKHIRVFLIVYLAYLKDVVLKKCQIFEETGLNVGYVVSIERMLLDNSIGTKSDFEEIVSASGIVKSENTANFVKVITRGEGLLPLLQRHYNRTEFPLDSYFLLAHIHEDYIQLTLNKVVITGDFESEASSMIIKDKIISIENIYDSLCMNIWNCVLQTESLIKPCEHHEHQSFYEVQEQFSFDAREFFFENIKLYMSRDTLDSPFENEITVPITHTCDCAVYLDMNSMMEIAWKPTFKSIATTLSSSLENTNLFGLYYDLNYLFGFIHFNKNAAYQKKITYLLSAELNSKVVGKETSARCFIIEELPDQFLHPKNLLASPVFSNESFQRGNMTVVSKGSYGYSITLPGSGIYDTIVPSVQDEALGAVPIKIDKERAFLLLKKDDVIDHSGLEKSFRLERRSGDDQRHTFTEEIIRISIFRVKSTNYFDSESIIPLDNIVWEKLKIFELTNLKDNCDMPIIISVKYSSHLSSLYFSAKVKGQDVVLQDNGLALSHSTRVVGL